MRPKFAKDGSGVIWSSASSPATFETCAVCSRSIGWLRPKGGDGSTVITRVHGPRNKRCEGSRMAPRGTVKS